MSTIIALAGIALAAYLFWKFVKSDSGHASGIAKQAGRIVVNETKTILNKLENLEKSLNNVLVDVRTDFDKFKKNCATIFELEAKLTKDLIEQNTIKDGIQKELASMKTKYQSTQDEETKKKLEEAISFFLEKLQRSETKITSIESMLAEQKEQNAKVEADIRNYKLKIEGVEDKISYVKNQYIIAKNKEMLNTTSCSNSGVYNLEEIFRNVNEYINRVDGVVRVTEVVETESAKEQEYKKIGEETALNDRLKKFLAE